MQNIITFVGNSGSGKTTIIKAVVKILTSRGRKVAVIKHDGHCHEIFAVSDKDSYALFAAGAVSSIVSNSKGFVQLVSGNCDLSAHELAIYTPQDAEIILCEGFKGSDLPKVSVAFTGAVPIEAENIVAIASDQNLSAPVPLLKTPEDTADFIEAFCGKDSLSLVVNGKPVATKGFLEKMLVGAVSGLIKALKGCEEPKEIVIKVKL